LDILEEEDKEGEGENCSNNNYRKKEMEDSGCSDAAADRFTGLYQVWFDVRDIIQQRFQEMDEKLESVNVKMGRLDSKYEVIAGGLQKSVDQLHQENRTLQHRIVELTQLVEHIRGQSRDITTRVPVIVDYSRSPNKGQGARLVEYLNNSKTSLQRFHFEECTNIIPQEVCLVNSIPFIVNYM